MPIRLFLALLLIFAVSACSGTREMGRGEGTPGQYKVGEPYEIDGVTYYPKEDYRYSETGIASWYGPGFEGKHTANGETFDPGELTAAHRTLPMPSLVRVTNLDNGKSVVVRVNDRGPFANNRVIDLSQRAAELLGFANLGTAKVRVDIMEIESRAIADAAKRRGYVAPPRGQVQVAAKEQEFTMPPAEMQPGEGIAETAKIDAVESVPLEPAPKPIVAAASPTPSKPTVSHAGPIKVTTLAPRAPTPLVREPKITSIPGHQVDGRFYPAPKVTQRKVKPNQKIYIQAGAFAQKENAANLKQSLTKYAKASVSEIKVKGKKLYRVRLGPLTNVKEADRVLLKVIQISKGAHITVE